MTKNKRQNTPNIKLIFLRFTNFNINHNKKAYFLNRLIKTRPNIFNKLLYFVEYNDFLTKTLYSAIVRVMRVVVETVSHSNSIVRKHATVAKIRDLLAKTEAQGIRDFFSMFPKTKFQGHA